MLCHYLETRGGIHVQIYTHLHQINTRHISSYAMFAASKHYSEQRGLHYTTESEKNQTVKLECGPMPKVMATLPNIGGTLCSMLQSLADAHY